MLGVHWSSVLAILYFRINGNISILTVGLIYETLLHDKTAIVELSLV